MNAPYRRENDNYDDTVDTLDDKKLLYFSFYRQLRRRAPVDYIRRKLANKLRQITTTGKSNNNNIVDRVVTQTNTVRPV